jgi:hypothetical protein
MAFSSSLWVYATASRESSSADAALAIRSSLMLRTISDCAVAYRHLFEPILVRGSSDYGTDVA